jgi:EpsI family protein
VNVVAGEPGGFPANRLVVQKNRDRQVVLYWYEGRGRRIASEYMNKLLLILDGMRENRTDAALVRITTPVDTTIEAAATRLDSFTSALGPSLARALTPTEAQAR